MQYVFDCLDKIGKELIKSKWVLLLDFDLTLSPLAKNPANAVLPEDTKILLKKLSFKIPVAIITGRAVYDIKKRVGLRKIIYVGNHGLEYEIGYSKKIFIHDSSQKGLKYVKREFTKLAKKYEGVILEDKKFSIAFHYRLLPAIYQTALMTDLKKLRAKIKKNNLTETLYKKTLEIKPDIKENKGTASLFILKKFGKKNKAIYIGDGKTDEDAFLALPHDITIKVGKSQHSAAKYYLRNVKDVGRFLKWLLLLN